MGKKIKLTEFVRAIVKKNIREALVREAEPDKPEEENPKMTNPHENPPEAPPKPAALPAAPNVPGEDSGETPASHQAHALDLTGKPFGNFANDQGQVVAKSIDGGQHLVKLEPKDEPSSKLKDMIPHAKNTDPDYDPYADDAKTTLKHQGTSGNFELTDVNSMMLKLAMQMKDAKKSGDTEKLAGLDKQFSTLAAKKRELTKPKEKPPTSAANPPMKTLAGWKKQHEKERTSFPSMAAGDAARKSHDDEMNAAYKTPSPTLDAIDALRLARTRAAIELNTLTTTPSNSPTLFDDIMAAKQKLAAADDAVKRSENQYRGEPSSKLKDMVPQDVKDTVRDTTAFSRAANPTSDMNTKIDKVLGGDVIDNDEWDDDTDATFDRDNDAWHDSERLDPEKDREDFHSDE